LEFRCFAGYKADAVGLGVFITEGVKFIISKMACHFHKLHTHATFTDDWKKRKELQ